MTRNSKRFRFVAPTRPQVLLVSVPRAGQSRARRESSAAELTRLAQGLGMDVLHVLQTSRAHGSLLGEQRLIELASWTGGPGPRARKALQDDPPTEPITRADLVLVDGVVTPAEQRTLEEALGVPVLDRSAVILRVFAERAGTLEARLQVELARRLYQAPRIRDERAHDDRRGGGGRGGRGNSNVQLAKQANRARIAELQAELEALPARAELRRQRREGLPQAALVGYTNAGKSSLLRALTGSSVHVADELFATLDLTVRALAGTRGPRILVSDTVGFLGDLPAELIASFRATLEEARHADLLLLVVDAADPEFAQQLDVTRDTLDTIGAGELPQQLVFNKCDRLTSAERAALSDAFPDAWWVSAHDSEDAAVLRDRITARVGCASPWQHDRPADEGCVSRP